MDGAPLGAVGAEGIGGVDEARLVVTADANLGVDAFQPHFDAFGGGG